jgi:Nucleoporin autopeptidase
MPAAPAKSKRVQQPDNPAAPTLTRDGYYTAPPLKLLRRLGDEQLAALERFVVGREDYGEVQFLQVS